MEAYRRAFIATGSFEPVKHVMVRARVPRLAPRPIPKTDPLHPRRRDPPRRPPPARRHPPPPSPASRSERARAPPRPRDSPLPRAAPPTPVASQAGVFLMAFGMEHYFHHKYHAHAEASRADHSPPAAAAAPAAANAKPAVDAGLPPAAAAALAEPLPGNVDDLTEEIKSLRAEIATLRRGIRVAADAASEAKKKK